MYKIPVKKSSMLFRKLVLSLTGAVLILLFQNCSPSSFQPTVATNLNNPDNTNNIPINSGEPLKWVVNSFAGSSGYLVNKPGYDMVIDSQGNVFQTGVFASVVLKTTSKGVTTIFAGDLMQSGVKDGIGVDARFNVPYGIAIDLQDNLYVSDMNNHTIRKITPAGEVTTFAGITGSYGSTDGDKGSAQFFGPKGILFDSKSNAFYISDSGNYTIRKLTADGTVSTIAGKAGDKAGIDRDGIAAVARFSNPSRLTLDSNGVLYIVDGTCIRKMALDDMVTTIAGNCMATNYVDGDQQTARFQAISGIAVDASGIVYVTDGVYHVIRKINIDGSVQTFAGTKGVHGSTDGFGLQAQFKSPAGMILGKDGNLYLADSYNYTIRKITTAGEVTTFRGIPSGYGNLDGQGASASFNLPRDIVADANGNLYVADTYNSSIRKITKEGIVTTLLSKTNENGTSQCVSNLYQGPGAIAVDGSGNIYFSEPYDYVIRKLSTNCELTLFAGVLGQTGTVDGPRLSAKFVGPKGLAFDKDGNLLVADNGKIRKITSDGQVTTLQLTNPVTSVCKKEAIAALTLDGLGNIYFTTSWGVCKVTPDNNVMAFAGKSQEYATVDGQGENARFQDIGGIASDVNGNIYVGTDYTIRKIDPNGNVTTIAGRPKEFATELSDKTLLPGSTRRIALYGNSIFFTLNNGVAVATDPQR